MSRRRALLSVSDKTGIEDFARELARRDWELISTGGTAARLRGAGLDVTEVADLTDHPEMMEGRVKTLHPAVHAGLLARRARADDMAALAAQGYHPIDLVAVNLYPFRQTVAQGGVGVAEAMEQVDIGGPTMIRAAAKNHDDVVVVVDPQDYAAVLHLLDDDAGDTEGARRERRRLAAKVFRHISAYDAAVARFLAAADGDAGPGEEPAAEHPVAPAPLVLDAPVAEELRYGENPDQTASFHRLGEGASGIAGLEQLHGKALSYNNILDLDGALLSLAPFAWSPRPAVAIIKHTTPCGVAVGETAVDAYTRALACDPVSAFGSIIAVNRPVDDPLAEALSRLFVECIVAPGFDEAALERLTRKKNLRLLVAPGVDDAVPGEPTSGPWTGLDPVIRSMGRFLARHSVEPLGRVFRSVYGGVLVQSPPRPPFYGVEDEGWRVVTERAPTASEWDDLRFAWAASFGVKSNAIVLARGGATVGIGAGQMSRVDASKIAVRKARDAELELGGAALASDAFFPFRDGVDAAADAGVTGIVQPGGSIRDEEVIAAADEHGITMVFTGRRLFRH